MVFMQIRIEIEAFKIEQALEFHALARIHHDEVGVH
jgi:hypothetical protein